MEGAENAERTVDPRASFDIAELEESSVSEEEP